MNLISVFNLFYLKENENSVTFYYKETPLSKPLYLNAWAKHSQKDKNLNFIDKLNNNIKNLSETLIESSKLFKNNPKLKDKVCNNITLKNLYSFMDYDYIKNNSEKNPFSFNETKLILKELKGVLWLALLEEDDLNIDLNNLDSLSISDLFLSNEISSNLKQEIIQNILKNSFKFRNSIKAILQNEKIPEDYKIAFKEQLKLNTKLLDINKLPIKEKIEEKRKLLIEMKDNVKNSLFGKNLVKVSILSVLGIWIGFSNFSPWTVLNGDIFNSNKVGEFEFSLFNTVYAAPRNSTSNSSSSNSYSSSSDYSSNDSSSDYSNSSSSSDDYSSSDYSTPFSSSSSSSSSSDWSSDTSSYEEDPCPSYQSESVTNEYNIKNLESNINTNLRGANSKLANILNFNNVKWIYFEDSDTDYTKDLDGCEVKLNIDEEYSYGWAPYKSGQKVYYYFTDYNESITFKTNNGTKTPSRFRISLNNGETYQIERTSSPSTHTNVVERENKTIHSKINSFDLKFPDFKTKVNYEFNQFNSKAIYTYFTEEDSAIWTAIFKEEQNEFENNVKRTYFTHINSSYTETELAEVLKKPRQFLTLNIQDTKIRKISWELISLGDKIQVEKDWVLYDIEVISDWSEKLWKWFIILLKSVWIVAGSWVAIYLGNLFIQYIREQNIIFDMKDGLDKTKLKFIETFNKVLNKFKTK